MQWRKLNLIRWGGKYACVDIAASVPKTDIVLAWHEPELRKYTEYAVA